MVKEHLPVSIEAEKFVLGSVLLNEALMHDARQVISGADFSRQDHQRIWNAMCAQYDAGKPIDNLTVFAELDRRKEAQAIGGLEYLAELLIGIPDIPNIDRYIQIVKDKSLLRGIIAAGQHLVQRAM